MTHILYIITISSFLSEQGIFLWHQKWFQIRCQSLPSRLKEILHVFMSLGVPPQMWNGELSFTVWDQDLYKWGYSCIPSLLTACSTTSTCWCSYFKTESSQTTKLICKYKASCPVFPPLRLKRGEEGCSSSSGPAAGVWNAKQGAHSAWRCVRKPFTVTQSQKCLLSCQQDSLCPTGKSSPHLCFLLAHLANFPSNPKGRLLADCFPPLQCHRTWGDNTHSQEEKLWFDWIDQLGEGDLWRTENLSESRKNVSLCFISFTVFGEWTVPPSPRPGSAILPSWLAGTICALWFCCHSIHILGQGSNNLCIASSPWRRY